MYSPLLDKDRPRDGPVQTVTNRTSYPALIPKHSDLSFDTETKNAPFIVGSLLSNNKQTAEYRERLTLLRLCSSCDFVEIRPISQSISITIQSVPLKLIETP